jgi:hypothetical protein
MGLTVPVRAADLTGTGSITGTIRGNTGNGILQVW